MNPITLDSSLQQKPVGPQTAGATLVLQPSTTYPATLIAHPSGSAYLQLQTPQGSLAIEFDPQQAQLVKTAIAAMQADPALQPGQPQQQTQHHTNTQTQSLRIGFGQGQVLNLQLANSPSGSALSATVGAGLAASASSAMPQAGSQLQVQLRSQSDTHIALQIQLPARTQHFVLTATQLLHLLQPLQASASPSSGANAASPINMASPTNMDSATANSAAAAWSIPVSLQRQASHLLLTLANQRQLQVPLHWFADAEPAGQIQSGQALAQAAQLQLQQQAGQWQFKLQLPSAGQSMSWQFSPAQSQQLLATLSQAAQASTRGAETASSNSLSNAHSSTVTLSSGGQQTASPSTQSAAMAGSWQLRAPTVKGEHWQLEVEMQQPSKAITIDLRQLSRPVQLSELPALTSSTAAGVLANSQANSTVKANIDVAALWRQWLPLSQLSADPLALDPELPAAVQAVLQNIKQPMLDAAKSIAQQQLQQQLTAALQFNPQVQPTVATLNTGAATVAIAIQLLLGRLANTTPAAAKSAVNPKLQQLIQQLEPQQTSQLLRQLAGHASTMQGAQLATAEQQQAQSPQVFIQLPLLQQGEQRFVEFALSEREADGSQSEQRTKYWQLTMKFDLVDQGHLLVQVRLQGSAVHLQFYTEQSKPLATAQQFLPLLKDRLKMQGIEVVEAQCQLGKIPAQLYQRSHSLLAVKA